MKNFTWNREELITTAELALAFILPIWGGMYIIAKVFS